MSEEKIKLDLATKLSILKAEDDGLSVEEIAKKFHISHAVYIERILKKRTEFMQSPDVINLNKKGKRTVLPAKSRDDFEDLEVGAEQLDQSTSGKRQKVQKQNILSVEESPVLDTEKTHRFRIFSLKHVDSGTQLHLISTENEFPYNCLISGMWCHSVVCAGDVVNIKSPLFSEGTFTVNNQNGSIIVNPDRLISCTSVTGSIFCTRKSWLGEKFRGWSSGNKAMLVGSIVHELFQAVCLDGIRDSKDLKKYVQDALKRTSLLHECYASRLTEENVIEEVQQYIPHILDWVRKYVEGGPTLLHDDPSMKIKVLKVLDIEDNIWLPKLGLKGKVDVTAEVKIHDKRKVRHEILPIELKTGKSNFSSDHQGQTALYSMMMDKRFQSECNSGLLLYLKDGAKMKEIALNDPSKSTLLQRRNDLAYYSNKYTEGPEFKESLHFCSKCEHLIDCCLVAKCFEPEKVSQSMVHQQLIPGSTGHLSEAHMNFFGKWITLLNMEIEAEKLNHLQKSSELHFWNESSKKREEKGLALANMALTNQVGFDYTFTRSKEHTISLPNVSELISQLKLRDRVSLSLDEEDVEDGMIALATGHIESVNGDTITLSLGKKVQERLLKQTFRIDILNASSYTFGTNFTNILRLMAPNELQCMNLRSVIIDKKVPQFKNRFSMDIVDKGKHILKSLNETQQRAVLKTLSTSDYLLIQGMPGAGKTQTIVAIVRLLVELKKSVLITSFTHSAVDNILLKLKEQSPKLSFLRLGSSTRIHRDLQKSSCDEQTKGFETVAELEAFYAAQQVVATTCLGVYSHPLFAVREAFDYCVLDEASQVLLPTVLGPLFTCKKFILVGDSKQLPPVIHNKEACEMGMDQSLFSLLQTKENTVELTIQYRMNREITKLANRLTYNNVLRPGSKKVAERTISCGDAEFSEEWIRIALNGDLQNSVKFLDTDGIAASMKKDPSGLVYNSIESALVEQLCKELVFKAKIDASEIGIITPYQRQVRELRKVLSESLQSLNAVEVSTVDQYQGRDKDVVIISCVRSSVDIGKVSFEGILSDERRLNVALTRARKKLLIIGSVSTLKNYVPFKRLLTILRQDQVYKLSTDNCSIK